MIALENVTTRAGAFTLRDISVSAEQGSWTVVLGAAGAGKTTLLEAVAGIRPVDSGAIRLRNADVTNTAPESRRLGIVYQHAYLFPHLSVRDNIAYGIRSAAAVDALVERFGASALLERDVTSLSGGERQVVALLRAIAPSPDILLLDEPFSALDAARRARVRSELRGWCRQRSATVVHVTHDLIEAGSLGDQGVMLEKGRVQQVGSMASLFREPASRSVAEFMGVENVLTGAAHGGASGLLHFVGDGVQLDAVGTHAGGAAHAVIRAEAITLARDAPRDASARNVLRGAVLELMEEGALMRVTVGLGATTLVAVITRASAEEMRLVVGEQITASIKATAVHIC